jgi:hypothetical protein
MAVRYGRTIAALIVLALFLAVVILFGTVDLNLDEHALTDVRSAPILSTDVPATDDVTPLPLQSESPLDGRHTPAAGQ